MSMKVIAVGCIKGGTGKSATAGSLAQAAVKCGKKVLFIDADMQGNGTQRCGADTRRAGLFDVLRGRLSIAEAVQHTSQGIDVISGTADLIAIETSRGSAGRLLKAIEPIKEEYDLCIVDTAPAVGELVFEAVYAADLLLICVHADLDSLAGLYSIEDVAARLRPDDPVTKRTIITEYEGRANVNKRMREVIEKRAADDGSPVIGIIRKGATVSEARYFGESLFDIAPRGKPAMDYMNLYKHVMEVLR